MTGGLSAAFDWMLRATWQASCLAVLVLLVQWACGRRLSARARCWLWAIVIARLMLPPLPAVRWTLLHARAVTPIEPVKARVELPRVTVPPPLVDVEPVRPRAARVPIDPGTVASLRAELAAMREKDQAATMVAVPTPPLQKQPVAAAPSAPVVRPSPSIVARQSVWPRILRFIPWLWLAGMTWVGGRVLVASVRLWLTVRRLPRHEAPATAELLASCARQMGLRGPPPELCLAADLPGPALAGWLRPKLLVPPGVLAAFDAADLRLMFLHELAHVRRRDVAVNWLLSAVTAVHWFNPIVWLCVRRVRADRELACDELVLASSRDQAAVPAYGHTLLRLADWLARGTTPSRPRVAGVVEILEDARELQRRIVMIARFNPATMKRWPAVAAGGVLLLAGLALTDAAEPAATRPAQHARAAAATQPRAASAAAAAQSETARLMQAKVDAIQAQLKARQEGYELAKKQFEAGVPPVTQDTVARAAAEVAEVKMGLTDAQIAIARERGAAADVPKLMARKVAEAKDDLELRKSVTALSQKRYEAALCDYTAVTDAQSLEAKAQAALADAKLALDAADRRAGGGGESPAAETAESLDLKWREAKIQAEAKEATLKRLQALGDGGAADATDVARAAFKAAFYRLEEADAAVALARVRRSGDVPAALDRRKERGADVAKLSDEFLQLMKKKYAAGLCELSTVQEAEADVAWARGMLADAKAELKKSQAQPPPPQASGGDAAGDPPRGDFARVMKLKVDAAKAKLAHAEAELARSQDLTKQGAISQSELEQSKAAAAQARAELAEVELQAQQGRQSPPGLGGAPGPAVSAASADLTAAVQDPDAQRLDEESARKLLKPVQVSFRAGDKARPISQWTQDVAKAVGVNVIVQGRALEEAGIAVDTPVGLSLQEPAPAAQVLTWALRDLGGSGVRVGYTIDHGAVVVSTADHLSELAVTRVYDVSDLATPTGPGSDLPGLLVNVIDPPSWRDNGGVAGVVLQFRDKLVVTQSQQNHADVARLLTLLRAKAPSPEQGARP